MKYLKIVAIAFAIGILLEAYAYLNLMVSYKYEVDLMETHIEVNNNISDQEKVTRMNRVEHRKLEIERQKKTSKYSFVFFLLGFTASLYFLYRKRDVVKKEQ